MVRTEAGEEDMTRPSPDTHTLHTYPNLVCDLSLFPALTTLELVGVAPSFLARDGLAVAKARLRSLTFQVGFLRYRSTSVIRTALLT